MTPVSYDKIESLSVGTIVTYRDYTLDRHERKHLSSEFANLPIESIIPAGTALNRETLEIYLGKDLENEVYLANSVSNNHRLVLKYTDVSTGKETYYMVSLNPYFMSTKQQELFTVLDEYKPVIPNYNRVLGFKDYDFGGIRHEEKDNSR